MASKNVVRWASGGKQFIRVDTVPENRKLLAEMRETATHMATYFDPSGTKVAEQFVLPVTP